MIGYGVCTGSWEKFGRFVLPRVGNGRMMALYGERSIPEAYNAILDRYQVLGAKMVILLHDDLELTDPEHETKFARAFEDPDVALAGVAGGRNVTSLAWWEAETVGFQITDTRPLHFSYPAGEVDSLEGSIMAFGPWAIDHLRFDTRFTGFHGYDDIGMCAKAAGKKVIVADIATHHHTHLGFKSEQDRQAWFSANEMFKEKWGL